MRLFLGSIILLLIFVGSLVGADSTLAVDATADQDDGYSHQAFRVVSQPHKMTRSLNYVYVPSLQPYGRKGRSGNSATSSGKSYKGKSKSSKGKGKSVTSKSNKGKSESSKTKGKSGSSKPRPTTMTSTVPDTSLTTEAATTTTVTDTSLLTATEAATTTTVTDMSLSTTTTEAATTTTVTETSLSTTTTEAATTTTVTETSLSTTTTEAATTTTVPDTTFDELNQTITGAMNQSDPVMIELICAEPIVFDDEIIIDDKYFVLKPANGFDKCVLDGNQMTRFFRAGGILGGGAQSYNVKFLDLTFMRGRTTAPVASGSTNGGAINLYAASVDKCMIDFTNCDFIDNEAIDNIGGFVVVGGAIFQSEGSLNALNCSFRGNRIFSQGVAYGAAVYQQGFVSSQSSYTNCIFQDNFANALLGAEGGAIAFGQNSNSIITGSHFVNNTAAFAPNIRILAGSATVECSDPGNEFCANNTNLPTDLCDGASIVSCT